MEGSVVITGVDEGVSRVELVEWLDNPIPDDQDILNYYGVLFEQVLAAVHGEDLPYPEE